MAVRLLHRRLLDRLHGTWIHRRRVRRLAQLLAPLLPEHASVLDVGCGDGAVARSILELRPDLNVEGIDVLLRPDAAIPVSAFDGCTVPFPDGSFDAVLLADVLHHTEDPARLLGEAARVARRAVVVKDHRLEGILAGPTLRFMDRAGNERHGVALPYTYWPEERWRLCFAALGLSVAAWTTTLRLYPLPLDWLFGRGLHFVARLEPRSGQARVE
jgi:SAM-dependent methyltransferase